MAMTVKKRKDARTEKVILHRIADIPGGVSVRYDTLAEKFKQRGYIPEGTPIFVENGVTKTKAKAKEVVIRGFDWFVSSEPTGTLTVDLVVATGSSSASLPEHAGESFTGTYGDLNVAGNVGIEGYVADNGEVLITKVEGFSVANTTGDIAELNLDPILTLTFLQKEYNAITGTGVAIKENDNIVVDALVCAVVKAGTPNEEIYKEIKGIITI